MNDTLIGVIVGAAASAVPTIVAALVQARSQDRRERTKLIFESAQADRDSTVEWAKHAARRMPVTVPPIGAFVVNSKRLLDFLEARTITREQIRAFKQEMAAIEQEFLTSSAIS